MCFIYPSGFGFLWKPLNTYCHIASTRERATSISEQLFRIKEAFCPSGKMWISQTETLPHLRCNTHLILLLLLLIKLQNICLLSNAQPDLVHKKCCSMRISVHNLLITLFDEFTETEDIKLTCFSESK